MDRSYTLHEKLQKELALKKIEDLNCIAKLSGEMPHVKKLRKLFKGTVKGGGD